MHFGTNHLWAGATLALALGSGLGGCGGVEVEASGAALVREARALTTANGTNLNGTNLNGTNLNGTDLNGTLVAVRFAGATKEGLTGNKYDQVELRGTEFWGYQGSAIQHGTDFDQAHFIGEVGDGSTVELLIAGLTPNTGPSGDVWTYRVSFFDTKAQAWKPLCTDAAGQPVDAIPVQGRWDYRQGVAGGGARSDDPATFTFACEGAAIAKCVRMGYRPWATVGGVSLKEHHQACTRVIRADFCGDGASHTVDGQLVNVFDALGVQVDTEPSWYLEAEWDAGGARCFSPHNRSHAHVSCYQSKSQAACGQTDHFSAGTLLMTETPYKG